MEVFELVINEESNESAIQAISLVENPAIESDWVTLNSQAKISLALDEERKVLMGAALIPNKPIYRRNGKDEFYIYFTPKTIRKASELFFKNSMQKETTLDHAVPLEGNTVVESWIKEDEVHDKSVKFGINVPIGTWLISMKIEDDAIWKMAKNGIIKGFSIEGYFADSAVRNSSQTDIELFNEISLILENATK
jgi:hypothetical protein